MKSLAIVVAALFFAIFSTPAVSQTPECQTSASPAAEEADTRSQPQPRALEISLGRRASAEYETAIKLFCDDTVYEYVNRIAQTVAHGSNVRVPITIKVVDSSEINAVSFPGGFLYINSGLILAVENGHFDLAVALLEAGVDPNDQRSGFTALHALTWVRKPNRGDGDDARPAAIYADIRLPRDS